MKVKCNQGSIDLIPETVQDEVYLRHVLGIQKPGDIISVMWHKPSTVSDVGHIRISRIGGSNE